MTKPNGKLDLLGKRGKGGSKPLALHEKSKEPYTVEEKVKKGKKRKSIFTKTSKYCTCTGPRLCSKPKKPKK